MSVRGRWAAVVLGALALSGCGRSVPAAERSPLRAGTPVHAGTPVAAVPLARRTRRQDRQARGAARHQRHANPTHGRTKFLPVASGSPRALDQLAALVEPSRSSSSSAPSSPAQFVSAADGICTAYRHTVQATGAHATTLAAQQNELSALVGETAAALKRLGALAPPAGQVGLLARFIGLTRASVGDFVKAQTRSSSTSEAVGTSGEAQDMSLAQRSAQDALGAQAAAHQLGLHVCGSEGAEWL
jgi:hypothetical protein